MGLWLAAEQSTLDCVQARISLMEDEEYQRLHRATAFPGVLEFPDSGITRVFSLGSEVLGTRSQAFVPRILAGFPGCPHLNSRLSYSGRSDLPDSQPK